MQKTQPIRNTRDILRLKQYYLDRNQIRNYALLTLGMNTSLRIGDLLLLRWENVYDFHRNCYHKHLEVLEQKTRKNTRIALNKEAVLSLQNLKNSLAVVSGEDYLFRSRQGQNRPIKIGRAHV